MEIVYSVLGKIGNCLFHAGTNQLGYLLHYNDNIQTLRKQVKKLEDTRERVQGKIDAAYQNGEIIEALVETWKKEVHNITAEAEYLLEYEEKANKTCFKGCCINLKSRYRFSKEAQQKTKVINELQNDGNFECVSRRAPPPDLISSSKEISVTFESRESIKKQIMEALKDDDVGIIGVCGMGGVGKTTLVKEIGKQAKDEKLYDRVVMVVVSKEPRLENIQEQIAYLLGLTLPGIDQAIRAGVLRQRIKSEKRILIILDDVWGRIELHNIGIPFKDDHEGCKIVLTSRSQGVCNQMDAQKIITVGTLSKRESWILFKEVAGQVVDNSDISPIARRVAAKCGGLPIAILTVGRALKNQNKYVWTDAARHLKNSSSTNIDGMDDNVFSILKLSYDYLQNEEAKELFLLCCFFPEDSFINMEDLLRYGIGLRWFKDVDTVEEARVRVHSIVSTLTSCFLLINENGSIRMHDVIRDFAIKIAPTSIVKAGIGQREWPKRDTLSFQDLWGVSLMSNNIVQLPDGLECPNLQVLLLQNHYKFLPFNSINLARKDLKIPNSFFEGMKDLKVLDLSYLLIQSLPSSLSLLSNLRTLCLSRCSLLVDLSIVGKLTNLEILVLSFLSITEIPIDFAQLTHLKLLDLSHCKKITVIPYGVMSRLHNLEELNLEGSFMQWDLEREGSRSNAKFVELKLLSRLSSLQICIPRGINLPCDMPFQNLKCFSITVGAAYELGSERYSRSLMLSHEMTTSLQFDWVKDLLKRTEKLILCNIIDSENFLRDQLLLNNGFNELKFLTLESCTEVKYLLNTLEWTTQASFRNLEILMLHENPNLVEICHGQLPVECFSKVKEMQVTMCDNILTIVPSHLLQRLQNLQKFIAFLCNSLVYVFDFEGLEILNEEKKLLSSLNELRLFSLPKMTHIWNADTQFLSLCNLKTVYLEYCPKLTEVFPPALQQSLTSLKHLRVRYCDELEELFGKKEKEDHHQQKKIMLLKKHHTLNSPSLGNLFSIDIQNCNKLKALFTPSISKSLVQLKLVKVSYCSSMQEIIMGEEGAEEASTEKIVFPCLSNLSFKFLDSFTCFCAGLSTIEFPALKDLFIVGCPNMKTFGYGDQVTPKLDKVKTDNETRWLGNLNATVQQLFNEQAMAEEQDELDQEQQTLPEITAVQS